MAFDLLHDLMNVAVQDRDRAEPFQIGQGAFAVVGSPSPFGIHRPEWNVSEDDDRRAAFEPLDVALEPLELFGAERTEPPGFEIDDVDEADEVHAALIEAVPASALRPFAEPLQVTLPVIIEHVVFTGNVEHGYRQF